MTNTENENKGCCSADAKKADSSCCATKKKCCGGSIGNAVGMVLGIVLIGWLGWYTIDLQKRMTTVCIVLADNAVLPALTAPSTNEEPAVEQTEATDETAQTDTEASEESAMQEKVDELKNEVIEAAKQQNTLEGQYIVSLETALRAISQTASCRR